MKSKFITFEGGEGAGKTTLMAKIAEELKTRSLHVLSTRAPGATLAGQEIRHLLLDKREISLDPKTELFLFLADRAEHVEKIIQPALARGEIVLCDRFNDSTIVYQGIARGLGESWVEKLCHFASSAIQPDLTLYLDISPDLGLHRLTHHQDKIEAEGLAFHQSIRSAFQKIAKREPKRFHPLDASKSKEEVFKSAMNLINPLLPE